MSETSTFQYASIEQPSGAEPPIVHCPICGHASVTMGEAGGEITPCAHMAFLFIGEIGEFGYQSEDFAKRFEAIEEDSLEEVADVLSAAGYGNELLALEITYGGAAADPLYFTDVFGFDYSTIA
ncbi:MAG: hypothetical protein ACYC2X_09515 [Coriobacteriia bacterium]